MKRFHVQGTIQKTCIAEVDGIFEGEDEADAFDAAMQNVFEFQTIQPR